MNKLVLFQDFMEAGVNDHLLNMIFQLRFEQAIFSAIVLKKSRNVDKKAWVKSNI